MRLELRAAAPGKREERPGILAGCRETAFPHVPGSPRRRSTAGLPAWPAAAGVAELAAASALHPHAVGIAAPGVALDAGCVGHLPREHGVTPWHLAARTAGVVAGAIDFLALAAIAVTLRPRVARGQARGCQQRAGSQHDLERNVHDGPSMTVVVPPR